MMTPDAVQRGCKTVSGRQTCPSGGRWTLACVCPLFELLLRVNGCGVEFATDTEDPRLPSAMQQASSLHALDASVSLVSASGAASIAANSAVL
jgi:hypothetical protein